MDVAVFTSFRRCIYHTNEKRIIAAGGGYSKRSMLKNDITLFEEKIVPVSVNTQPEIGFQVILATARPDWKSDGLLRSCLLRN
ncbi:unnamed protein product, partial [Nesidiocoris tenuis]